MLQSVHPLQPLGPAYRYTVSLEPYPHRWIFALDWPSRSDLPGGTLSGDYTLMQRDPVTHPIDVAASSYTRVESREPLGTFLRGLDTQLPAKQNPRTLELARTLRSTHPDDAGYVQAVLNMFAQQAFFYTLTPPKLSDISVRHETRILRTLRLGIRDADARGGHTGACRDRLPRRDVQSIRGLLDPAAKRRACLGRDLDRGTRVAAG
jgi:hypothetical protein